MDDLRDSIQEFCLAEQAKGHDPTNVVHSLYMFALECIMRAGARNGQPPEEIARLWTLMFELTVADIPDVYSNLVRLHHEPGAGHA